MITRADLTMKLLKELADILRPEIKVERDLDDTNLVHITVKYPSAAAMEEELHERLKKVAD